MPRVWRYHLARERETAASNKTALIFYKKFGFKPYYIALQKELSKEED